VKGKVLRKMMLDLWASKAMLQPEVDKQVVMKTSLRELILYWSVFWCSYMKATLTNDNAVFLNCIS
jgi:hypothetical protein